MDLTLEQKEILVDALTVLKFEGKEAEDYEDIVRLKEFVEKSDVVLYPELSDEDKAIIEDKLCPDCNDSLEYDQADPSGQDMDEWSCHNLECNGANAVDNMDGDELPVKKYMISYERRAIGCHSEIY